jgi:hypothetical protein
MLRLPSSSADIRRKLRERMTRFLFLAVALAAIHGLGISTAHARACTGSDNPCDLEYTIYFRGDGDSCHRTAMRRNTQDQKWYGCYEEWRNIPEHPAQFDDEESLEESGPDSIGGKYTWQCYACKK